MPCMIFRARTATLAIALALTALGSGRIAVGESMKTYIAIGDSMAFGETDFTHNPSNGDRGYVGGYADYLGTQNGGVRPTVIDLGVDQLFAQVRRGVNHDPRGAVRARTLDQQRAAAAAVFRVVGIASAPAQCRSRYAGGGAAAEDGQRHRHAAAFGVGTFENSRKKFSVVCREISSSETPRVSASTFATSTT